MVATTADSLALSLLAALPAVADEGDPFEPVGESSPSETEEAEAREGDQADYADVLRMWPLLSDVGAAAAGTPSSVCSGAMGRPVDERSVV